MTIYFVKSVPVCGKGILEISSVELWLSERLQITSLFHLPDTVSTFLPWVFMDVTCKAACSNAICPASDSHFSPSFITATFLWILAILTCHGLFQASFTSNTRHTIPCDPRKSCDPLEVTSATHGYFSASMHWWIYESSVFLSPLMHLHFFIPL